MGAVVVLVSALFAAQVPIARAATAAASAPSDLGSVLAAAPDASYHPVSSAVPGFGSLDPMTLATETRNIAGSLMLLTQEHFTRAYQKGWVRQTPRTIVEERVTEFEAASGAQDHIALQKQVDQSGAGLDGLFSTPGFDGYGGQFNSSDGFRVSVVLFVKGNLLFEVKTADKTDPGTTLVLDQATKQYEFAPAATVDPNGFLDSANVRIVMPIALLAFVALIGVPALLILSAVKLIPVLRRRSHKARPERPYWWDGSRWRSPDGSHWFDGAAWRPLPPAT